MVTESAPRKCELGYSPDKSRPFGIAIIAMMRGEGAGSCRLAWPARLSGGENDRSFPARGARQTVRSAENPDRQFRRTGGLAGGRLVGQNRAVVANPMEKGAPVRGRVDVARRRQHVAMIVVVVQRVTAVVMMPMSVRARLGRAGDGKRGHRKGGNRSQNHSCFFHSRSFKNRTGRNEPYTRAIASTRDDPVRGVDVTVLPRARQAISPQRRRGSEAGPQKENGRGVEMIFRENASLLTDREIFPQFEGAEPKLVSGVRRRRPDQRKRGIRELLPDRQIFRRNREPPEPEHVSARLGHSARLLPCDFIDQSFFPSEIRNGVRRPSRDSSRRAGPERLLARAQLEGVELQGKRRQRQPQIIEFFGSRLVAITRSAVGYGSIWPIFIDAARYHPAGRNRRGFKRMLQSIETDDVALAPAADFACSITRSTTGNCRTVTRCPSQSCVTSTWLPSGNSIASW